MFLFLQEMYVETCHLQFCCICPAIWWDYYLLQFKIMALTPLSCLNIFIQLVDIFQYLREGEKVF